MREIIARAVAGLTLGVIVALAAWFAFAHNPTDPVTPKVPPGAPAPEVEAATAGSVDRDRAKPGEPREETPAARARIDRGRAVYERENCATCHSLAGAGNPRYPLDGVGARRTEMELESWVTGTGAAADLLPGSVARRKQRYQTLPAEDLQALTAYLARQAK